MLYTYRHVGGFTGVPGCPSGGHMKTADPGDEHFAVSCPVCEPVLAADPAWRGDPNDVPLTQAERLAADRIEREQARNQVLLADGLAGAIPALVEMSKARATPAPRKPRKPRQRKSPV